MDRSLLKSRAKEIMQNNKIIMLYFFVIFACIFLGGFLSNIPFIGFIITLGISICGSVFMYGLSVYYAMDEGTNSSLYFEEIFKNIGKFIKIYLWYFLKVLPVILISVVILVPIIGIMVYIGISTSLGNGFEFGGLSVLVCIFLIGIVSLAVSIISTYISLKYNLSLFMAFDEDFYNTSAKECVQICGKMMDGHKMEFFILQLSFILWFIGGIFTLGLLYIYIMPYYQLTIANYYLQLKNEII